MSGETVITVIGNTVADPELRFLSSGQAVVNFTIASTPRTFDKQSQEWRDGETLFLRCDAWREQAESIAESVTKGTRLVVTGRLSQRSWEDKEGNKRTSIELHADEVAVSLRFAQATVRKTTRGGSGDSSGGGGRPYAAPDRDPWSSPVGAGTGGYGEQPPF